MRDTQPATPAIAPDYPDTANRATEMGWAEGRLSDGRPWMASLWEDAEGENAGVCWTGVAPLPNE